MTYSLSCLDHNLLSTLNCSVEVFTRQAWHAYYDIFVRHAFGSLRDVMREVAYSPMMGDYLTFLRSTAIAYDGS